MRLGSDALLVDIASNVVRHAATVVAVRNLINVPESVEMKRVGFIAARKHGCGCHHVPVPFSCGFNFAISKSSSDPVSHFA